MAVPKMGTAIIIPPIISTLKMTVLRVDIAKMDAPKIEEPILGALIMHSDLPNRGTHYGYTHIAGYTHYGCV